MRTRLRSKVTLLFMTLGMLLAVPAIALADNISNTLDPTVDAVAENMPLVVGGANGTTKLYVDPTNGDGKNGCNLTGSTSLTISLASDNTSVATVSPSTVTFNSCVNSANGIPITVTPGSQGTANITATQVSNTTGATFDLNPVKFTVTVAPPPNTPPSVTVTGVTGGASYNKGSVPAATCNVTDAEDGNSSFPATLSAITGPYASDGIGSQTASCSYTDNGGATAAASLSYSIVDPSSPVITNVVTPATPDGNNGWYKSNVSLTWTVTENESPSSLVKTGCVNQNITTDQAATVYSCSATSAGGSAGPQTVTIKRDGTKPTISGSASPAPNANGWNNEDVTVGYTCDDNLSGVASCGPNETLTTEGADQSSTGTAVDNAGNSDTATVSNIDIDKTPPSVDCDSADGLWHNADVSINCTASDTLSDLASSGDASFSLSTNVPADTETDEAATGTRDVSDKADNSSTAGPISHNMVDKKAPTFSSCPVAGPFTQGTGLQPVGSITANDGGSGVDNANSTLSGSVDTNSIGSKTVTFTAKDKVANSRTTTCSYDVDYNWSGFFSPIDNKDGSGNYILNKAKAGSVVPVKFSLHGDHGLNVLASGGYPQVSGTIPCSSSSSDLLEEYGTGNVSSFKYDATADQYIYNWKSDTKWAGQCRQLVVKLADDTYHRANFSFFK